MADGHCYPSGIIKAYDLMIHQKKNQPRILTIIPMSQSETDDTSKLKE